VTIRKSRWLLSLMEPDLGTMPLPIFGRMICYTHFARSRQRGIWRLCDVCGLSPDGSFDTPSPLPERGATHPAC
jgi:hypothetical protein